MSILVIKSGTTEITGGTVKGDFTYFSATTRALGGTIDTGFWSGVDPTCDGYTVYKIGGQHGWAAMVATGREQLNYYLKLFGGTGTTVDENVTWATNANNIFLHSGSTGPCPTLTPTPTSTSGSVTPTPTSINCVTSVSFDVDSVGDVTYLTCCGVLVYLTVGLGPQVINDCLQFGSLSVTDATISNISYGTTPCICSTPTPTTTPTPTPTLVSSLGCSGGTISGTYSGNNQYTYPNQPISSIVDSYINFSWGSIDRPNRFSVYDSTGLLWTSGWVGFADYAGPWGPSLNTPSTGNSNICFLSPSGRYVLVEAGNASPITPISDAYEYTLTCLGSCPGGATPTPTSTPTSTPAGIQATIAFSFFDTGGVVSARMEVTNGVTLDSLSWGGTGIGYSALGCSGTENIQSFNDVLGIGATQISTEVWGSISAILSAQNQTSSFSVNGNTINTVSQIITVGGHNYLINAVTNCFSPLTA